MDVLPYPISEEIDVMKYRLKGETFREKCSRIAGALCDDDEHFREYRGILLDQRFLPAGRVQASVGAPRAVTPLNCFVSGTIPDSMDGIMDSAKDAARTMRLGGGIGFDFSPIRPRNDLIVKIDSLASGPVSFMAIYNAVCQVLASYGHRRGAMMAVLRVDHPDIEEFIKAKRNSSALTGFNMSVGATDKFMHAVIHDEEFDLVFNGRVYKTVQARALWDEIMRSTWDYAEPGVLFIDQINRMNNLWYCETIAATNPCGEQPLPPYGACLLGSLNTTKYLVKRSGSYVFDMEAFKRDIPAIVRAQDNIIDRGDCPLPEQKKEMLDKRRMGLGITGIANTGEAMGMPYGSPAFIEFVETVMRALRDGCYWASVELAKEKGAFPLYDDHYLDSEFIKTLPDDLQDAISVYGIRNSHLISIAPTGTISLTAENVSSGIEPTFSGFYDRTIQTADGPKVERVFDYGVRMLGVTPRTADECSIDDHLKVLAATQFFVDSACSKTCNVGADVSFNDFKEVYVRAWKMGCKGITTFRAAGKRAGILVKTDEAEGGATACEISPITGQKECEI